MLNIKKPNFSVLRLFNQRVVAYGLILILIVTGFLLFHHINKTKDIRGKVENRNKSLIQASLNTHNYKQYQLQLCGYADAYTTQKEYAAAESALGDIMTNVPRDKITSRTYRSYWYLYRQKGDANNRKKYALLAAAKLKQEGQPQAAVAFEKDANGG